MRFPVFFQSEQVGWVDVDDVSFHAVCRYACTDILRLFVETYGQTIRLGIPEPDPTTGEFILSKPLPNAQPISEATFFLDDGSGKYTTIQHEYEAPFFPGKQHDYAYLLTACQIEKTSSGYRSYLKKTP